MTLKWGLRCRATGSRRCAEDQEISTVLDAGRSDHGTVIVDQRNGREHRCSRLNGKRNAICRSGVHSERTPVVPVAEDRCKLAPAAAADLQSVKTDPVADEEAVEQRMGRVPTDSLEFADD